MKNDKCEMPAMMVIISLPQHDTLQPQMLHSNGTNLIIQNL